MSSLPNTQSNIISHGLSAKEVETPRQPVAESPFSVERIPVVEVGRPPENDLGEHLKAEPKENWQLPQPVVHQGEVLIKSATPQEVKIVLPVTERTFLNSKAWHQPVTTAIRWLLAWSAKVMKLYPNRTVFPQGIKEEVK